eukprot:341716_1
MTLEQRLFQNTKCLLLNIERQKAITRCHRWEELVNRVTIDLNTELFGCNHNSLTFNCTLSKDEWNHVLRFIYEWKGLKPPAPDAVSSYEHKSRNWANGRRARLFADTLFAIFISKSEAFAHHITRNAFKSDESNHLYFNTLMHAYLYLLCSAKVQSPGARRVMLLCDNSFKAHKSKLKRMFQHYAHDCPYPGTFPEHRCMAMDYFAKELKVNKDKFIRSLRVQTDANRHNQNHLIVNEVFSVLEHLVNVQCKQQFMLSNVSSRINAIDQNVKTSDCLLNLQKWLKQPHKSPR